MGSEEWRSGLQSLATPQARTAEIREEVNLVLIEAQELLARGRAMDLRRPELRKLHFDFFIGHDVANLETLVAKLGRAHSSVIVDRNATGRLQQGPRTIRSAEAEDIGNFRRYDAAPAVGTQDDFNVGQGMTWVRQEQALSAEVRGACKSLEMKLERAFDCADQRARLVVNFSALVAKALGKLRGLRAAYKGYAASLNPRGRHAAGNRKLRNAIKDREREFQKSIEELDAFAEGMVAAGLPDGKQANASRIRSALEPQGVLFLPEDADGNLLAMGGLLPSEDYMLLPASMSERHRMARLTRHANALITKYHFLDGDGTRRLAKNKDGCVCIMFAEEVDGRELIYVPFFGISGYSQVDARTYLNKAGVPHPGGADINTRFLALVEHCRERIEMGLKLPAKQSALSYMQYMSTAPATDTGLKVNIRDIVRWDSIQCAEPAAVMAAAQLYYRMSDMKLSVPFEGKSQQAVGSKPQGKETCGRCAISERCFAGVVAHNGRRIVQVENMRTMDEFQGVIEEDRLIYNVSGRQAYPRAVDMRTVLERFNQLGLSQFSQQRFWMHNSNVLGALSAQAVRGHQALPSLSDFREEVAAIRRDPCCSTFANEVERNASRPERFVSVERALEDLQGHLQ